MPTPGRVIIEDMDTAGREAAIGPRNELADLPRLTVRQAVQFGGFAEAVLVAGASGLDRRVEWVRIMETPETFRFMHPGEVLLTTAYVIKDDPDALVRLVGQVDMVGGAAIVVKPERYIKSLPAPMIEEADRLSLPLFTMADHVPWTQLMEPLLERLINEEHWRLKRSMEIHRRFTQLVLDGLGVQEIADTLSQILDCAVSVEDASFVLLAHSGGVRGDTHRRETIAEYGTPSRVLSDPGVRRVLNQVEKERRPIKSPPFPHIGMDRERIIAPIMAANQVLGYISVIDLKPHLEDLAFLAVEQAATVTALALTKERELLEVETRVRGDLLEEVVRGTYGDEEQVIRRARHLGYPVSGSHVLLIADIDDFRGYHASRNMSEEEIQTLKREFLARVSSVIKARSSRTLFGSRSDMVMALIPTSAPAGEPRLNIPALAEHVRESITRWKRGFTVSVGYSREVEFPGGVNQAHEEVKNVLTALARFNRHDQVVSVADLGLTGLLASVPNDRLLDFARRHLEVLAQHDVRRGSELIQTLRVFLECRERQAAAKRLDIHPNTLKYRLDRISEICGCDLEDPETQLNMAVALKVYSLLKAEDLLLKP